MRTQQFAQYLHIMEKLPTGVCEGCQELETVEHVTISCRKYIMEQEDMIRIVGNEVEGLCSTS